MRLLLVLVLATAGCVPAAEVRYTTYTASYPPVPHDEYVPPAPGHQYVWLSGYWFWDGVEYVWVAGHWAVPPRPSYVWVRSGWVETSDGYVFVAGRWVRPGARPRYRYVHPSPRVRVERGRRYRHVPRGRRR